MVTHIPEDWFDSVSWDSFTFFITKTFFSFEKKISKISKFTQKSQILDPGISVKVEIKLKSWFCGKWKMAFNGVELSCWKCIEHSGYSCSDTTGEEHL